MLNHTPFYDFHVEAGAKMVDFAGWEMPLLYRGIVEEHNQTRNSGSIFDVSHMGRLYFTGKDAEKFLNRVLTRNVSDQQVGQSRYSLVCNASGGVLDDVIISKDSKNWILVCNASNREKLVKHFNEQMAGFDVEMNDQTESTAMAAIQGPKVIDKLADIFPVDVRSLKRYHFETGSFMGMVKFTVFRSGYTGEDGIEIIIPGKMAGMAMKMLGGSLNKEQATIMPAGLGARDTLRLEAGMPLYGHELDEKTDPLSAGLNFAVDLNKDFIGAEALRNKPITRKLVGLELDGKRIARQGAIVRKDEKEVGTVTSGTFSPTLQKSISMAYVETPLSQVGTELMIDLKGSMIPAKVVKLPFYKRK